MPREQSTPTHDDDTEVGLVDGRLGVRPYVTAFRQPGRRLRVVLLVSLPVYLLGLLAIVPLQLAGGTAIVNGRLETTASPTPGLLVAAGIFLGLALISTLIAHGAAVLVGLGEGVVLRTRTGTGTHDPAVPADEATADERASEVTLRYAVTAASYRLPTLAVLWLLGMLLIALIVAGGFGLVTVGFPIWLSVALLVLVTWFVFSPFTLALPVALAERRGPFGALRRSMRLTRGRTLAVGAAVLVFGYALPGAVAYVVARLPDMLGRWVDPSPLALIGSVLGWIVAVAAIAVLASVQVSALFHDTTVGDLDGATRDDARGVPGRLTLDRARLVGVVSAPCTEWRWVRVRPSTTAIRMVAALLVPGLLVSGLLRWNPTNAPAYTETELSGSASNLAVTPVAMADGSAVSVIRVSKEVVLERCTAASCRSSLPSTNDGEVGRTYLDGAAATAGSAGRVVLTGGNRDADRNVSVRLVSCRPEKCDDAAVERAPVIDRFGHESDVYNFVTAVARDGHGGYLIASLVERGPLSIYHCADARCARPKKVALGNTDLELLPSGAEPLSLATDGERVALATTNPDTGAVDMTTCADLSCTRHRTTRLIRPSRLHSSLDTQNRMGVSVAYRSDGRAVVAYRDLRSGRLRLMSCAGPACAERSDHALTGPGWAHPWPALAIDRTGRPLVATYDLGRKQLVVASCRDVSCARTATVRLGDWRKGPGYVGLAVDRQGRPVLVWSDSTAPDGLFDRGPIRVLRCERARCGAD